MHLAASKHKAGLKLLCIQDCHRQLNAISEHCYAVANQYECYIKSGASQMIKTSSSTLAVFELVTKKEMVPSC